MRNTDRVEKPYSLITGNPKLINDIGLITRQWPGRVDFSKDLNHE
jgi:hypothetical protein